jgi:hypothetical protein
MSTNALQKKMIDEFLEKIKDWPEDAKRSVVEAVERMLNRKPDKPDNKDLPEEFWKSFGAWDSDETWEELAASIRNDRTDSPDRESL